MSLYRWLLSLAMVFQMTLSARPAEQSFSCEASADIQSAINIAGSRGIEALLQKYPNDFWVRLAHIDSSGKDPLLRGNSGIPTGPTQDLVIDRYRKESETRPKDLESAYLYAYSLVHKNTAKSVEILTGLTQSAPSFPRPWLSLAVISAYPGFSDQDKVRMYTEKFLALCPNTLEPRVAGLALQLDRSDTVTAYAKTLRERIAGKEDEQTLALYTPLWQLESKLALPAEQAEYRKRLESDLKFLEGLDKIKYRTVNQMLTQGYQRLGKEISGTPTDFASFRKAQNEWQQENLRPVPDAKPETRAAYYKKQLQFLDRWLERLPNDSYVISSRFMALSSMPDVLNETLIREGNQALEVMRRSGSLSTNFADVLRVWAQRGLELERIPSLVQEFVASQQRSYATSSSLLQSDLYGESYLSYMLETLRWSTNTKAWGILVTTYAKNHKLDKARDVLAGWEKALNARRSKANEIREKQESQARTAAASERSSPASITRSLETSIISGLPTDESNYYEGCAQLATAEDRALDALVFYQASVRLIYGRSYAPADLKSLDNVKESDKLWKKLGGSQAGWNLWLDSINTMTAPRVLNNPQQPAINRTIPQFSLVDQNGKSWTLNSIKGKKTLINVWATWCGPCRLELPLIQALYEKTKDRDDIQIITLNIDSDETLVKPFLVKNNFSFPSLFAKPFVNKFAGPIGIPTTWIVDSAGNIRNEILGYSSSNSDWVAQTMKRIENVNSAAK
jgi:thiol-disulfide isomerase/thioredoxin